ncbi:mechanosensitive ion channel family protein [Mucilaginibacter sp. PAMB04274]|uniref:mechanosensitive ion channel family protein n=1 Tax=Mucilaginibacter sp. PAMB04274 TaxID=3138568 RepID=UPI0031F69B2E
MIRKLQYCIILTIGIISMTYGQKSQMDSITKVIDKMKQDNSLLRIKDSIKTVVIKEGLDNLSNPKTKELEQYKNELVRIRLSDSLRLASQKAKINALREKIIPFKVKLSYKELFDIYSDLGPLSAQERAIAAQQHITGIYNQKTYVKDSLRTQEKGSYINILYEGNIITSIGEDDAIWENTTKDSLAAKYIQIIDQGIDGVRNSNEPKNILLRWAYTVGVILLLGVLLSLLNTFFKWLIFKIAKKQYIIQKNLKIKNYQILSPHHLRSVTLRIFKTLYTAIVIVLVYISLSIIFSIFPSTERLANDLARWIWQPIKELGASIYSYFPKLFKLIVILIIGRYVNKLLRFFSIEIKRGNLNIKGFYKEWATPTYKLLRICLMVVTIIIIFPYLPGSDTEAFKGISVFFGILISIGSSSAIANTIAGFIITYMRPFKEGDWIMVNEVTGEVKEKTALVTRIRTITNQDITIPNSMILTNKTVNFSSSSLENALIIPIDVFVSYTVSFERVNELLIEAALEVPNVEKDPAPYVFKNKLDETYIVYRLHAYTRKPEKMYFITSDLNENILRKFNKEEINLLSPRYYPKPKEQ